MTTRRVVAWGLVGLTLAIVVVAVTIAPREALAGGLVFAPGFLAFAVVGALITMRAPTNVVGPLLLAVAAIGATTSIGADTWARADPPLPGQSWAAVLGEVGFIGWFGPLIFVFFRFPDGHPVSAGWRRWERLLLAAGALALAGGLLSPGLSEYPGIRNPIGVAAVERVNDVVGIFVWIALIAAEVAAAVSLFVRFRRSRGAERQRMKWLVLAAGMVGFGIVLSAAPYLVLEGAETSPITDLLGVPFLVGVLSFPIAVGIAILRHRLFDIDLVISKAVVYGAIAAFIAVVYVGIVVGIGTAAGSAGNPFLSAIAAAIVAIAFQPVRRRAQAVANRLVYGKRASPYEVLSGFADRLAEAYSVDDVLPRMARVIAEGTGAALARVWLGVDSGLRPVASWPADAEPASAATGIATLPDRAFEVRHQGEALGAITVAMPPNEPMTPAHEHLVADLAAQAGLVLRNARLLQELRESRRRIVAAQDERAKKLERNIHDGAQQQLVALAVKLKLADALIGTDEERAHALLAELHAETGQALEDLRDLARGIYPPLLADRGLTAALEAQARKSPLPVLVDADGIGRYAPDVEAAVYFSTLEALQNVAKYARASHATVHLEQSNGSLRFEVADDGAGFEPEIVARGSGLQGMADRLSALGGDFDVRSSPGRGTTIVGALPAEEVPA